MNPRLAEVFERARNENRAVLIGYLPADFPTHEQSVALMRAMVDNGVDLLEVGLPYSDPLMDGPAIQEAVSIALSAGSTTASVLDVVREVSASGGVALVMSYWNPIERYGVERFSSEFADAGGVGVITPDLTPEEATAWREATDTHGIDRTFLVAPSSTDARLSTVTSVTTGFVYAASTMGVTGTRTSVSSAAPALVTRVRDVSDLPVCVGLGVSTGEQAADVARYADGVIVGSAFIAAILAAASPHAALDAVGALTRELAAGVRAR